MDGDDINVIVVIDGWGVNRITTFFHLLVVWNSNYSLYFKISLRFIKICSFSKTNLDKKTKKVLLWVFKSES